MRVLGIDPSLKSTGFGLIEGNENDYIVLDFGCIKASGKLPFHDKINAIRINIEKIIHTFTPDEIAVENPFYAQNIKTALILGQVRGAILVAVADNKLPLFEYSPLEIKKSVTGYGQADKDQVRSMVSTLLHIDKEILEVDASDALATAFCHLNSRLFQKKIDTES